MRWSILMNRLRIDLSRIRSINFRRLLDIRCQFSAKGKENIPSSSCPFGGRELNVSLFPRQRRISNYSLSLPLSLSDLIDILLDCTRLYTASLLRLNFHDIPPPSGGFDC